MHDRTCGWNSDLPTFKAAEPHVVRIALQQFIRDASPEQVRAWEDSIPWLQRETGELLSSDHESEKYTAILEYQLPLDARRPDVVILLDGPVVVLELKGKVAPTQADLDQVAAYARDLRCYHRECHDRPVHAVLVPTRASAQIRQRDGIYVVGPEGVDQLLRQLRDGGAPGVSPQAFLDIDAYQPLPSLVQAARELFRDRDLRYIKRARAATEPAVDAITRIAHEAARTGTRHLVLVTGVPGSGKTLVGLRAVHTPRLDDLAVQRGGTKASAPAVFLSGNGPLVEVLQYQLRDAGGGGQTFVRGVKNYLDAHVPRPSKIPAEHVLVFDEAQRAFSAEMVAAKHPSWPAHLARSEPELFVEVCERIPEWCVLVGLIGWGQEIHRGEEEGLRQWRIALERARSREWTVHAPTEIEQVFAGSSVRRVWCPALNLNTSLRFHLASKLHEFVESVLQGSPQASAAIANVLWRPEAEAPGGICYWATRDWSAAKEYLRHRYENNRDARFGIVASSKDKDLEKRFGIPNSYQATKQVRLGPWYAEDEMGRHSCRHLETAVTEFGAQGLELDMALLAWGTDLIRRDGRWSIARSGGYRGGDVPVKSPQTLRINAYRVLLTRGRDGTVVFVPPLPELDETWEYLLASGFRALAWPGT